MNWLASGNGGKILSRDAIVILLLQAVNHSMLINRETGKAINSLVGEIVEHLIYAEFGFYGRIKLNISGHSAAKV